MKPTKRTIWSNREYPQRCFHRLASLIKTCLMIFRLAAVEEVQLEVVDQATQAVSKKGDRKVSILNFLKRKRKRPRQRSKLKPNTWALALRKKARKMTLIPKVSGANGAKKGCKIKKNNQKHLLSMTSTHSSNSVNFQCFFILRVRTFSILSTLRKIWLNQLNNPMILTNNTQQGLLWLPVRPQKPKFLSIKIKPKKSLISAQSRPNS